MRLRTLCRDALPQTRGRIMAQIYTKRMDGALAAVNSWLKCLVAKGFASTILLGRRVLAMCSSPQTVTSLHMTLSEG